MHVIVTGATGFVGRPLVRALLARKDSVTALTRDPEQAAEHLPAGCAVAAWREGGTVEPEVLRGADAVVHLAGAGIADRRWSASYKRAILDSRVATTKGLVAAIGALPSAARPRTLVAASGVGFYGDRGDETLDESSPPGTGFLPEVCIAWEKETFAARDLGVRPVALRTGIVLDAHGGALAKMLTPFRLGVGGRVGSGRQWMSWITLDDLVALYLFAIDRAELDGPVNAVAPTPVTNADFTRALGRALGRPAIVPAPAFALRMLLGEFADSLLTGQRAVPARSVELGFTFQFTDLEPALANLL